MLKFIYFYRDGKISKAEMMKYFFTANCHALRNSFKHEFHETTYFKPTFCIHCTGLVSNPYFYSPYMICLLNVHLECGKSWVWAQVGSNQRLILVFAGSVLRTQYEVIRTKTVWLGIKIMCQRGATCLPLDSCFSELAL